MHPTFQFFTKPDNTDQIIETFCMHPRYVSGIRTQCYLEGAIQQKEMDLDWAVTQALSSISEISLTRTGKGKEFDDYALLSSFYCPIHNDNKKGIPRWIIFYPLQVNKHELSFYDNGKGVETHALFLDRMFVFDGYHDHKLDRSVWADMNAAREAYRTTPNQVSFERLEKFQFHGLTWCVDEYPTQEYLNAQIAHLKTLMKDYSHVG